MPDKIEAAVLGEGIVKTFKDFWGRDKVKALRGVDIVIPKGSVFGLLGPNGAGKSTLIKLILGHLYPTSGRLSVLGKDPRDVENKFKIGYLPERSYLYKNLTAEETLYYFGEILNLSKDQIKSRGDQLLEMVGLQNAKKRYVGEFSHGMTRRMGMAQALLNDPDFIILDEPTAGLDPVGCREVKDLIITLGKRGKTVLLTSHLLADVEDTCDELLTVYGGTVQSKGKVGELLADTNRVKVEFPADCGVNLKTLHEELKSKAKGMFSISSPKQSLEQYFLNIVNKSNKTHETAGAQQGKGVAGYLKAGIDSIKNEEESDIDEGLIERVALKSPKIDSETKEAPSISPSKIEVVTDSSEKDSFTSEDLQVPETDSADVNETAETPPQKQEQKVVVNEKDDLVEDLQASNDTDLKSAFDDDIDSDIPILEIIEEKDNEPETMTSLSDDRDKKAPLKASKIEYGFNELRASAGSIEVPEITFSDDDIDEDLDEKLLDDLTI